MKKINWKVLSYLLFTVVLVYSQNSVFAQNNQSNQNTQRRTNTSGNQDRNVQNNQQDDDSRVAGMDTTGREQHFRQIAKEMATDLMNRVNLSLEQAAEISDILVDYQKDVSDIKDRRREDRMDNTGYRTSPDRTGTGTTGGATTGTTTGTDENRRNDGTVGTETDRETDRTTTGTTGTTTTDDVVGRTDDDQNNGTMTGNNDANDLVQEFRNADEEANSQIEEVLEDNQIQKYMSVKKDWWSKVKSRVHTSSPLENNLNIQNEGMENNDSENNNIK